MLKNFEKVEKRDSCNSDFDTSESGWKHRTGHWGSSSFDRGVATKSDLLQRLHSHRRASTVVAFGHLVAPRQPIFGTLFDQGHRVTMLRIQMHRDLKYFLLIMTSHVEKYQKYFDRPFLITFT